MASRLILVAVFALCLVGCGKKSARSSASPTAISEPAQDQAAADRSAAEQPRPAGRSEQDNPTPPSAGSAAKAIARPGASETEVAAALGELTQALRKYSFEQRRLPKSFSEVVAAGYVKSLPQAPPGRKFAIDAKTVQVVLVKQ